MPPDSIDVQFGAGRALFRLDEAGMFDDHDLMSSLTGVFLDVGLGIRSQGDDRIDPGGAPRWQVRRQQPHGCQCR